AVALELTADNNTKRLNEAAAAIDLQELVCPPGLRPPVRYQGVEWARLVAWCAALGSVVAVDVREAHLDDAILRELLRSPHLGRLDRVHLAHNEFSAGALRLLFESPA